MVKWRTAATDTRGVAETPCSFLSFGGFHRDNTTDGHRMTTVDTRAALAPPYNLEAEEAVLGAVLIDSDAYLEVAQLLRPDDFYSARHAWLWEAYVTLHEQRMPIDIVTVQDELERHGRLSEIGGPAYLTQLVTSVATSFNVEAYGRLVEEAATRRRLLQAASDIAKVAYDEQTDIGEVVGQAEQSLFSVSQRRQTRDLVHIRKVASDYYDRVQYLFDHRDEPLGVPTGFRDLDKILGGMQKSDLIIIAGRPGQGKSGFMISVALNAARHRKHVAFFSLEMSNEQVVQRMIAQETEINTHRLRLGELEEHEWSRFIHSVSVLSDRSVYLDDTPSISALQLRTKARRLDAEVELDLIIVDYLQLMTAEVGRRDMNRVQEVSVISRGLKALARDLNVPVLAGAQLSRSVEQRSGQRPMLSDLRESGSIEQDSDVVLFLHHPDDWDEQPELQNVTEVVVAKHRNGPTGKVKLVFLGELAKFVDGETRRVVLDDGR